MRFVEQQYLAVENSARHAHRLARRRDLRREAAAQVQGQAGVAEPFLQEDEARVFADKAARFVALEQQRVDGPFELACGRLCRKHLGHHLQAGGLQTACGIGLHRVCIEDDPAQAACRESDQVLLVLRRERRQLDAEAAITGCGDAVERRAPDFGWTAQLEIDHARRTGAASRNGERDGDAARWREDQFFESHGCPSVLSRHDADRHARTVPRRL